MVQCRTQSQTISDSEEGDHRMTGAIQEGLQSLDFVDVQSVFP